jgi:hypothetical protein
MATPKPSELELHLDPMQPVLKVTFTSPTAGKFENVRINTSNETGQLTSGTYRVSKTWKWTDGVFDYRVQVQATLREEHR